MGAVAVLGGIWEIVSWEIVFFRARNPARSAARVSREDARLHGENREAYGTAALGRAFDRSLTRQQCGHEVITRDPQAHRGRPSDLRRMQHAVRGTRRQRPSMSDSEHSDRAARSKSRGLA